MRFPNHRSLSVPSLFTIPFPTCFIPHTSQGAQMVAQGNFPEAIRFLTAALQETPRDEALYGMRSTAYSSVGNFEVRPQSLAFHRCGWPRSVLHWTVRAGLEAIFRFSSNGRSTKHAEFNSRAANCAISKESRPGFFLTQKTP